MSEPISAALVQEVRDQLSAAGSALTPQWVAAALRARGVPVGDATVLVMLGHDLAGTPLAEMRG